MQGANGYPSMTTLYLNTMDRLWQICPDCLFLIEGAQMSALCLHAKSHASHAAKMRLLCVPCRHWPKRPACHLVRRDTCIHACTAFTSLAQVSEPQLKCD